MGSASIRTTLDLFSFIAVEPFRGGRSDVAGGVVSTGGNEKFFAEAEAMRLSIHFEFFFAFDQHHQFVGVMDVVFPHPARRSQSSGFPVKPVLRGIKDLSIPQSRTINKTYRIPVPVEVFWFSHNDIYGGVDAEELAPNLPSRVPPMITSGDDHYIKIAIRSHLAPRRGPKQDNFLRVGYRDDAPDDSF